MTDTMEDLVARGNRLNSPNYAPAPVVFDHGDGVWLVDADGNRYLDFMAGIAVCALGHNHPALTEAITDQARRLLHVSNLFYSREQIELMEALEAATFADRIFFCNSGAEANEAAFKLARRFQAHAMDRPEKTEILSMKKSFHGRTLAAITATGQPKYHKGFAPLAPDFVYSPFNDLEAALEQIGPQTAAVIVEPIQGEGGVRPGTREFLAGLRQACDDVEALLIFDEVQTGVGRTGHLFAYQHYDVTPDVLTVAKGLGGGVPLGAVLATERAWSGWSRGSHASTFGGNPLASRAGLAVLRTIDGEGLLENARARGEELRAGLKELAEEFPVITDVRGVGLMVGAECGEGASEVVALARQEGLLINTAGGHTLRFVPPLTISSDHVERALKRLRRALTKL